jgi:hypothetical protein
MTLELTDAGTAMAEMLEAENCALTALDLPRAGAMLARKQRALADLAAAAARANTQSHHAADRVARRLQSLAIENKRLLERALAAQGRVIEVVAACRSASRSGDGLWARARPTSGRVRTFCESLIRPMHDSA